MPAGTAHKIATDPAAPASALSPDQFDQLTALLDGQHRVIVDLLQPIHDLAHLMLTEHPQNEERRVPEPDDGGDRSGSEQSSG